MLDNLCMPMVCLFILVILYFFLESSNFLNMVLFLELVSMLLYFFLWLYFYSYVFSNMLFFLVMSVCEGALSLSLVVMMMRTYGDVMFKCMNLTLC